MKTATETPFSESRSQLDEKRLPISVAGTEVVVLPENKSAIRAMDRMARTLAKPGRIRTPFAPLTLHGSPGTGKSHLANALLRLVIDLPTVRTVQAIPANDIDRDADEPIPLIDDFLACDLLIIEDLQHLPKPSATLLCRLLDHRDTRYLPTVLTANAGPAGLTFLPRRLTNRLAGGLVVQVESLSPKSRRELVTFLADRRKLYLLPDAIDWIADRSPGGGIRPAIGLLESLKTQVGKSRKHLNRDAVAAILAPDEANRVPATVARIIGKVAAAFGIKPKELVGKSRLRTILLPRQAAMYLVRTIVKLPLTAIGKQFGGRDHTTVMNAIQKLEASMKEDAKLKRTMKHLRAELE